MSGQRWAIRHATPGRHAASEDRANLVGFAVLVGVIALYLGWMWLLVSVGIGVGG